MMTAPGYELLERMQVADIKNVGLMRETKTLIDRHSQVGPCATEARAVEAAAHMRAYMGLNMTVVCSRGEYHVLPKVVWDEFQRLLARDRRRDSRRR